uniref:Uncharacterized protein n=1 Tax=Arundo donax TaxID=35708 RepID=A0A0A9CX09_ARUDO
MKLLCSRSYNIDASLAAAAADARAGPQTSTGVARAGIGFSASPSVLEWALAPETSLPLPAPQQHMDWSPAIPGGEVAAAPDDSLKVPVVEVLHEKQQAAHEQRLLWWLTACSPGASALIDALKIPRLLDNMSLVPMDSCYHSSVSTLW